MAAEKEVTIEIASVGKGENKRYACGNIHFAYADRKYLPKKDTGEYNSKLRVGEKVTLPESVAKEYLANDNLRVAK